MFFIEFGLVQLMSPIRPKSPQTGIIMIVVVVGAAPNYNYTKKSYTTLGPKF